MDVFEAIADPVRRDLVLRMRQAPARVVDLAAGHDISRPAISRHLRVLGEAGLVSAEERGRERHYRLDPAGLAPLRVFLGALEPGHRFAESVLDGLDLEVRRTVRDHGSAPPAATHTTEETA